MNVLLTGNRGWIAGHIASMLDQNPLIKNIDTFDTGLHSYEHWQASWQAHHNSRRRGEYAGVDYDMILHVGALADSRADMKRCFDCNFFPTMEITDFCKHKHTKLLFFSSCMARTPCNGYSASKWAAERYIRSTLNYEQVCIFQPQNVWGFDEDKKETPSIVYQIWKNTLPVIFEDCVRDFIHVSDVVAAVEQVIGKWEPGTWQIGTAIPTRVTSILGHFGMNSVWGRFQKTGDPPYQAVNIADSTKLLPGWKAGIKPLPFDKKVKELWEEFLSLSH